MTIIAIQIVLGTWAVATTPKESPFQKIKNLVSETKQSLKSAEEKWGAQFTKRQNFFQEKQTRLNEIDTHLRSKWAYSELLTDYRYVVDVWRMFADNSFDNISGTTIQRSFPSLPSIDDDLREGLSLDELEYTQNSLAELKNTLSSSIARFEQKQEEDAIEYSRVLLAAGKLRSKQYQRLRSLGYITTSMFSEHNLKDLYRELRIIPVRWTAAFYSKYLEFRAYQMAGAMGYFHVLKEASLWVCLLGFFILFGWAFQKVVGLFEKIAIKIHKHLSDASSHWAWSISSNLVNHSVPWIVLLFGMWFAIGIVSASSFNELSSLFPYVDFYIYYRLSLIGFKEAMNTLLNKQIIELDVSSKKKLIQMAKSLGRYIFISLAILHTIDTVVGEAIFYALTSNIIFTLFILDVLYLSSCWHKEFYGSRQWIAVSKMLSLQFKQAIEKHWRVSTFFAMSLAFAHFLISLILLFLERYDFFKKFGAIALRSRLNKLENDDLQSQQVSLPEPYISQFNDTFVTSEFLKDRTEYKEALSQIESWVEGKTSQHTLVFYGTSGAGKTALVDHLAHESIKAKVHKISLFEKHIEPTYILRELQSRLGGTTDTIQGLTEHWNQSKTEKHIVCIDNVHHLFLSKMDGFEAIRTLISLVNSDVDNIFWCLSFHKESWQYLRLVMDEMHGFDAVLELKPWTAMELQSYIKKVHTKLGYKISFDGLLSVLGKKKNREDRNSIETKFFKLLWEQSNGNPTQAVRLWLRSVRFDGNKTMFVTRPPMLDIVEFLEYEDEVHFVCTLLLRHENLQRDQIAVTTQQSERTAARIIKFLLEKGLIIEESGMLSINSDFAGSIVRSLRRRNYVYG